MAQHKALVIDAKELPAGQQGQWNDISAQMEALTSSIRTPDMAEGADMSAVVSGVPSVFARANLFNLSLNLVQRQKGSSDSATSLIKFYENLVDEWRGLIACIALDYANIKVKRIRLAYSDGKKLDTTSNIYEPKGAFGNMLLKSRDLWCEQNVAANEEKIPFIDVIKYNGKVVGGTSPMSVLFTAPKYSLASSLPFVDIKTHRFTDPLHSSINREQTAQLLSYVEHLLSRLHELERVYADCSVKPDYSAITTNLQSWCEEIKVLCEKKGFKIVQDSSVPPVDCFLKPFGTLLNYSSELYGLGGVVYESEQAGAKVFDPKKLLLPAGTEIARLQLGRALAKNPALLANLPLNVLKAVKRGENTFAYFALPLSEEGLCIFGDSIDAMTGLNTGSAIKSTLSAVFDPEADTDNLEVKLEIVTNEGKKVPIAVKYTAHTSLQYKDLLLWPNFISPQWDKYYLYSELPHYASTADCPFRATPFLGKFADQKFPTITSDEGRPVFVSREGQICLPQDETTKDVKVDLLIKADNAVSDNAYKYEIYESNRPFKGVKLTLDNRNCGFLVIRYSSSAGTPLPHRDDYRKSVREARIGIDFGSTNTAVAYAIGNDNPEGIVFKNQTVSLFGSELSGNGEVAMEKDLFFFQNEEIPSNAIRSLLTTHDPHRVVLEQGLRQTDINGKEVKGGFPCFEKNLPITAVTDKYIQLAMNCIGEVKLVHNMKWNKEEDELANKKAFLRSLLLHVYAELFAQDHIVPCELKWSYPSSMGQDLLAQYQSIWDSLASLQPVSDGEDKKVKLSISKAPIRLGNLDSRKPFGNLKEAKPSSPFGENNPFGGSNPFGGNNNPFGGGNAFGGGSNAFGGGNAFGQTAEATSSPATGANSAGSSPFGSSSPFDNNGAFAQKSAPQATPPVDLKPDNGPIEFKFRPADQAGSMTEAQAVGCYIMHQPNLSVQYNTLTLCFDVGGSTTDISALCQMKGANGLPQTAMIKQNSIRFAAQRVSEATKFCAKELQGVLLSICAQNGLYVAGLNRGDNKFSPETAEYYFNQVVDSLTAEQLPALYAEINTKCPKLMAVNLYVTGLIMYYAGQLTRKVVTEVRRSNDGPDDHEHFCPLVYVVFAGKGSRIFEWLSTVNQSTANEYYQRLFIQGIGGMKEIANYLCNYPAINISPKADSDVKYEVAKGLVFGNGEPLLVPEKNDAIEILGEEGFRLRLADGSTADLPYDNSITPQMIEQTGKFLFAPATGPNIVSCPKFTDFASLFYQATRNLLLPKLAPNGFEQGFQAMNIGQYITNLPDFRDAQSRKQGGNGEFDYVAPIIILEGMKFYDDYLKNCLVNCPQ